MAKSYPAGDRNKNKPKGQWKDVPRTRGGKPTTRKKKA